MSVRAGDWSTGSAAPPLTTLEIRQGLLFSMCFNCLSISYNKLWNWFLWHFPVFYIFSSVLPLSFTSRMLHLPLHSALFLLLCFLFQSLPRFSSDDIHSSDCFGQRRAPCVASSFSEHLVQRRLNEKSQVYSGRNKNILVLMIILIEKNVTWDQYCNSRKVMHFPVSMPSASSFSLSY